MLEQERFYFHSIRKTTSHFGSLFDKVIFQKDPFSSPIEEFFIPLEFAPRDYFIGRMKGNGSFDGEMNIQRSLPRMTFELEGFEYDGSRQNNITIRVPESIDGSPSSTVRTTKWNLVPYNIKYKLNVFTPRYEDTLQIVEQILPYFTPQYTLNIIYSEELDIKKDVPVKLTSVAPVEDEWMNGRTQNRLMTQTLSFEVQGYIIPPITDQELVQSIITNYHFIDNEDTLEQYIYD